MAIDLFGTKAKRQAKRAMKRSGALEAERLAQELAERLAQVQREKTSAIEGQRVEGLRATSSAIGKGIAGSPTAGRLRKSMEESNVREMANIEAGGTAAKREALYGTLQTGIQTKLQKAGQKTDWLGTAAGLGATLLTGGMADAAGGGISSKLRKAKTPVSSKNFMGFNPGLGGYGG